MKKYCIILFTSILIFIAGCQEDFQQINKKDYAPQDVNPGTLLPTIIDKSMDQMLGLTFSHNNELMQYTTMNNTVDELHWYRINNGHSNEAWSLYKRMQDIRDMYNKAEEIGANNYMAIALILKSWLFSNLTDFFIDIPYSDAIKAEEGIYTPKFDKQEDIYKGIIADLQKANDLIDRNEELSFGGDILYNGEVFKWQKLCNSLLIRYLMRVSKRTEMNAQDKIIEIVNDFNRYPIFEGNDDAAVLRYSGVMPFVNLHSTSGPLSFELHNMSSTFIDKLKEFDDPRIEVFAEPVESSKGTDTLKYDGVTAGLPLGQVIGTDFTKSFVNNRFKAPTQPAILMSYAELEFLLAEAAQKGFITSDTKEHYDKGIAASFDYWNVEGIADYLDNPGVSFENTLDQIMVQKWLALYWNGMESWYDYRRTGLPEMHVGEGHDNDGKMPVRYPYPANVQTLNTKNYKNVVNRLGGNNINIKGWWEAK